jgi:hypothetical protein
MDHDAAKLRYGKAVAVEVAGLPPLLFRPLTTTEAREVSSKILAHPELSGNTAINACMQCCLSSVEDFNAFVDSYPLSMDGSDGVLARLIDVARTNAKATVKSAALLWRKGDRNYGHVAENLLAFKAYAGGDYTEQEFAGALAVAEWIGTTKNLTKLVEGLMKALARKR